MIYKALRWALVLIAAAFVPAAWACFPSPDAKPTHEISVIELSQARAGPAVVFVSQGFALYVTAEGLLSELSQSHMGVATPYDLANALRSRMPLVEDLKTRDLVAVLFSGSDPTGRDDEAQMEYRRLVRQAEEKLRYAFSSLLQNRKAVVTEIATGHALARVRLDTYSEVCHGGRAFMDSGDKEILRVLDWIS